MIKRICDHCGQDTGSSIRRGYGQAEVVTYGSRNLECVVRFIVEAPKDRGEGFESDLCAPCLQAVLIEGCSEVISKSKIKPELFNGA